MVAVERHPTFSTPSHQGHHRRRSSTAADIANIYRKPGARRLSASSTPQRQTGPKGIVDHALDHPQIAIAAVIVALFLTGVGVSVLADSSLNTSLLDNVHSHLEHRAYFAQKGNLLNWLFVKRAWAWTMAAYLLHLFLSPEGVAGGALTPTPSRHAGPSARTSPRAGGRSRGQRLATLVLASLAWIAFTSWFFGAGIGDRVIQASGGACAVPLPPGVDPGAVEHLLPAGHDTPILVHGELHRDLAGHTHVHGHVHTIPDGGADNAGVVRIYLPLPNTFCSQRIPVDKGTHPDLHNLLMTYDDTTAGGKGGKRAKSRPLRLIPRWSGGFDISGHAFLLTLGAIVLAGELGPSWRAAVGRASPPGRAGVSRPGHVVATLLATALVLIWVWMLLMTAVYFHNPREKLAGLALGLLAAAAVYVLVPSSTSPVIEYKVRGAPKRTRPLQPLESTGGLRVRVDGNEDENNARRGSVVPEENEEQATAVTTTGPSGWPPISPMPGAGEGERAYLHDGTHAEIHDVAESPVDEVAPAFRAKTE